MDKVIKSTKDQRDEFPTRNKTKNVAGTRAHIAIPPGSEKSRNLHREKSKENRDKVTKSTKDQRDEFPT
ncbi:hypothetical protein CDAR_591981 [Caerostris darwini]|uniref:Uncharacterized protein n=1 Tax=Caerostris darwini TaxID=1538125 RepID=A0AAV4RU98_9ARAC|nr:hypothetical protein CDAR_591981 [Caerostris darwini]